MSLRTDALHGLLVAVSVAVTLAVPELVVGQAEATAADAVAAAGHWPESLAH